MPELLVMPSTAVRRDFAQMLRGVEAGEFEVQITHNGRGVARLVAMEWSPNELPLWAPALRAAALEVFGRAILLADEPDSPLNRLLQ